MSPTLKEGNSKNDGSGTDNLAATTEKLKISESASNNTNSHFLENADHGTRQFSNDVTVKRIAKKSTASVDLRQPPAAATRRQVALANINKKNYSSHDKFMENFDPESSARERRKLNRKVNAATGRKVAGAVYDENGVHIATAIDLCDCLQKLCPGCHFPCPKCKSTKCGPECRCNRRIAYEQIEYHGCDLIIKNPLTK